MRVTYEWAKEAFIAECNRASNLSLGRAFFQDFEIEHFLNAAYEICMRKRLDQIDERYQSIDNRLKVPPSGGLPNNLHLLNDFGTLWGGSILVDSSKPSDGSSGTASNAGCSLGKYTQQFRVGVNEDGRCVHVLNPRLVECSADNATVYAVKIMRPITSLDSSKLSLVYQDDKYVPYVYYQIRKYGSTISDSGVIENDSGTANHSYTYIECSYRPISGVQTAKVSCNYDFVLMPRRISLDDDDKAKSIQVDFGYEIVLQAVQMAMESLGSERANTLAQMNNQTQQ